MALTVKELSGTSIQTVFNVDFRLGYLRKEYVYVYIESEGVENQLKYTWINDSQIELDEPLNAAQKFLVRRIVPRDRLVNDYESGAILRESNLNDSFLQTLMLMEEVEDGYLSVEEFSLLTNLDMNRNKIKNLGGGISDTDAANIADVKRIIATSNGDYKGVPYRVPPFDGSVIQLNKKVTSVDVFVDGRLIFPNYTLSEDGLSVVLDYEVSKSNRVVVIQGSIQMASVDDDTDLVEATVSYRTVADMLERFNTSFARTCTTHFYNREIKCTWTKVVAGAGNMSDGTLALTGGGYVKLVIEPVMDVRAFGAFGDHIPEAETFAHDDSVAIANAIKLSSKVTCTIGDRFAIAQHINCSYDDKDIDLSAGHFFWFGQSGPALAVGRDRAMFEIHGSMGEKLQESGPWANWVEGSETFPSSNPQELIDEEFMLLSVGDAPSTPEETYMVRPMAVWDAKSDPETRFQTDYRLGWSHENATFKYFSIYPVKNVTLKLGRVVDKTSFDYDERDNDGNRKSASATSMVYAYNCSVECLESENWQYPTVMTYMVTDCVVKNVMLLPSLRESISGIYGWGIVVQWNNALRPKSYDLTGQGNRRVLDYTAAAYAHAERVGDEATRDGAMTTHGVYEHGLTYIDTRGYASFGNSGAEFGETSKNITMLRHHGSHVFAPNNIINLHLIDCRADNIRVNSVGLVMDNCSLYDLGNPSLNNLMQINNFSKAKGYPYTIEKPTVINNSSVGSNGIVYLVDSSMGPDETIIFNNCGVELREGDLAGSPKVVFNTCDIKPKPSEVNNGRLILCSNPTKLTFNNCQGYNVGFEVPEIPFPVNGPVDVEFKGGTFKGDNFGGAFWSNRDIGYIIGHRVKFEGVTIDWDNDTGSGVFFDPLGARNFTWYTKVVNCDISGKHSEVLRIPSIRRAMRFGGNTLSGITKDIAGPSPAHLEYDTMENLGFNV